MSNTRPYPNLSQLWRAALSPNLFEVSIPSFAAAVMTLTGPLTIRILSSFSVKEQHDYLKLNSGSINVPFRGRILKVGDRTFEWTVTIINDEDFVLRTAFEKWSDKMSNLIDNYWCYQPQPLALHDQQLC